MKLWQFISANIQRESKILHILCRHVKEGMDQDSRAHEKQTGRRTLPLRARQRPGKKQQRALQQNLQLEAAKGQAKGQVMGVQQVLATLLAGAFGHSLMK